jgi:hypothetical protein
MKHSNNTIGNRSRYLLVCSAVPEPLRHRVPACVYSISSVLKIQPAKILPAAKFYMVLILLFSISVLIPHAYYRPIYYTGLFEMIVGVLTTCRTQYT